jgi:hypothetical protein
VLAAAIGRDHGLEQVHQRARHALIERALARGWSVDPQERHRARHAI